LIVNGVAQFGLEQAVHPNVAGSSVLVTAALVIGALFLRNGFPVERVLPCFLCLRVTAKLRFEAFLTERITMLGERHGSEQSARDDDIRKRFH